MRSKSTTCMGASRPARHTTARLRGARGPARPAGRSADAEAERQSAFVLLPDGVNKLADAPPRHEAETRQEGRRLELAPVVGVEELLARRDRPTRRHDHALPPAALRAASALRRAVGDLHVAHVWLGGVLQHVQQRHQPLLLVAAVLLRKGSGEDRDERASHRALDVVVRSPDRPRRLAPLLVHPAHRGTDQRLDHLGRQRNLVADADRVGVRGAPLERVHLRLGPPEAVLLLLLRLGWPRSVPRQHRQVRPARPRLAGTQPLLCQQARQRDRRAALPLDHEPRESFSHVGVTTRVVEAHARSRGHGEEQLTLRHVARREGAVASANTRLAQRDRAELRTPPLEPREQWRVARVCRGRCGDRE
mmetsp:Transcript_20379/g.67477  ORF Transcript_20379/g.67477 Transcript_20379/m.67477 type:complete len:363 (-) Transcript_20379:64-1152(-)